LAHGYVINRYDFLTPTEIEFNEKIEKFCLATNFPGPFSPQMWNDLVLKKIDYDLIYASSFPYDHILPAYVSAKKWKIPIIIFPAIHQEFPELYLTALRLTILNNSDAVFVQTQSEKNILVKNGVDEKKISIILPVISLDNKQNTNTINFRKNFLDQKNDKIVLFIGSKSYVKGIINLIEAMKIVWAKKKNVTLVLIGPSTKAFVDYFKNLPKNIQKKIVDLGIVEDEIKKNALASCDMLVLPSKSESFGLVYLEAWIFQKPVIGCTIASSSELIDNMKNGLLVEFGNIKQLSEGINYLIDNPAISEKMGKEGKKKTLLYDSSTNLKNFEEKCISVVESFKNKTLL